MGIKKIMCCCGSGLGSSLMIRLNVEKALKKLGIDVNLPKANRQLNVLLAAIQDVNVSIVRYENFSKVRLVG